MGKLSNLGQLRGKILKRVAKSPNRFSSSGAKTTSFDAATVRSPPLLVKMDGDIFEIDDVEFSSLISEYLF